MAYLFIIEKFSGMFLINTIEFDSANTKDQSLSYNKAFTSGIKGSDGSDIGVIM